MGVKRYHIILSLFVFGFTSASCKKSTGVQRDSGIPGNVDSTSTGRPGANNIFLITDFGAKGDGTTSNTDAIQKAIDSAASLHGTVIIPKGNFLCGPLTLHSDMTLYLKTDAILTLTNDIANFPVSGDKYLNFLSASKASNIKITGDGTIDGQGKPWWQAYDAGTLGPRRPQLIYIDQCTNIEISGIHTLNPPNTHFSLRGCKNVVFDSVTITAPADSHNTDGINISGNNILIEHCSIQTGDDNIAINVGSFPSGNIVVKHCAFGYGHGLSIGSYTSGGLDSLTVDSCSFNGTTSGIRMKTNRDRGGLVQNLSYSNITMTNIQYPIYISSYYPHEPKHPEDDPAQSLTKTTPIWKNISLKNMDITNSQNALIIWGLPEQAIENVHFTHVNITAAKAVQINNAQGIHFDNCTINIEAKDPLMTYNAEVTGL